MKYTQVKEAINDLGRDNLEELIKKYGIDVVEGYVDNGYSLSDFEEAYSGEWSSDEDFVQDLLESCGDLPKDLPAYIHIDWESTARDIMMDYFEVDGHYFRQL